MARRPYRTPPPKAEERTCAFPDCDNVFMQKPHTGKKYCDECAALKYTKKFQEFKQRTKEEVS